MEESDLLIVLRVILLGEMRLESLQKIQKSSIREQWNELFDEVDHILQKLSM